MMGHNSHVFKFLRRGVDEALERNNWGLGKTQATRREIKRIRRFSYGYKTYS